MYRGSTITLSLAVLRNCFALRTTWRDNSQMKLLKVLAAALPHAPDEDEIEAVMQAK